MNPPPPTSTRYSAALETALEQVKLNLEPFTYAFPENNSENNVYAPRQPRKDTVLGGNSGWTTSFWTGCLWLAWERSADLSFRHAAEIHLMSFQDRIERRINVDHHDIGFLYTLSSVAQHRLTGNSTARAVSIKAADVLLERWLPGYQILQSWGELHDPVFRGRFIVDCLLNLPLLFWAHAETGESKYLEVALEHARQSQRYLLRDNGRTYHTVFVDERGQFVRAMTHQGSGDESCWARGQAWAIYGFALAHISGSGSEGFLESAVRAADTFLELLPEDRVCYWDLDLNNVAGEERDSSAAAIAVCGLLDQLGPERGERYRREGLAILDSLSGTYANTTLEPGRPLLLHGVYRKPHGVGVDEGCLWGDYFYLEALTRVSGEWNRYW
jgi:unsaturated chondroitin disaccharide hydrolase